ncbi:hypothetical protein Leryth_012394 [Lithospermum erythrorhizon]|nr:hypothetical protein Leryth_012394 [Lithospermum erythrorhizon]
MAQNRDLMWTKRIQYRGLVYLELGMMSFPQLPVASLVKDCLLVAATMLGLAVSLLQLVELRLEIGFRKQLLVVRLQMLVLLAEQGIQLLLSSAELG